MRLEFSLSEPLILLDVPFENLIDLLKDKGWNVDTVTKKLGASKEARDDTNILENTRGKNCIIVTTDKGFVQRLKSLGVKVVTIEAIDKANMIDKKLKELV